MIEISSLHRAGEGGGGRVVVVVVVVVVVQLLVCSRESRDRRDETERTRGRKKGAPAIIEPRRY